MSALENLRESAARLLRWGGVEAVTAFSPERRKQWSRPVAAVSLSGVKCLPGAMDHYLGLREGREVEGREAEIALALRIFAPRDGGEEACQQTACAAAELLLAHGVEGMALQELEWGPAEWLDGAGLYCLTLICRGRCRLVTAEEDGGAFDDFEVKGRQT